MSDATRTGSEVPSLPTAPTADELGAAPVLASLDALVIDELSDNEYDAFTAALDE